MPSPKDGTPGTLVPPTLPDEAHDADNAIPGEVEKTKAAERETKTGKYGTQPTTLFTPNSVKDEEPKPHWIAIKLVDEDGKPVAGERYKIKLPDGRYAEGTTSALGTARVGGIDSGECQVSFPKLDSDAWKKA